MSSESSVSVPHGHDDEVRPSSSTGSSKTMLLDTEALRSYVSSVVMRLRERVTMDTLRPLPMFLGVTGPAFCMSAGAFTPPMRHMDGTAPEKIRARLKLNFAFFVTNYALASFGVAIVVALLHPGMLFFVGMVWGLWWAHEYMISNEVIVFGKNLGTVLSISQRSLLLTVITVLVIVWKCLVPFLSFSLISGVIILGHAVMRDPKHIESSSEFRRGSADSDDEDEGNDSGDSEVMVERGDVI